MSLDTTRHAPDPAPREVAPIPDPGVEEHLPRYTDTDERAGRRAYRQIVALYGLSPLLAIAAIVVYFAVPTTLSFELGSETIRVHHALFGLLVGLAILCIGVGSVHWAKTVMADTEVVEERHELASSPQDREIVAEQFAAGTEESGIGRRKLLGVSLAGALGTVALPPLVMLADMGPWPIASTRKETIEKTLWAEGVYLVTDVTYRRIRASEVPLNELVNAQPENLQDLHGAEFQQAKAKASIIIVRMDPNRIQVPESRRDWNVGGIQCYSKICTHVGCPVNLFERQTGHLLCPCHQSTFDLGNSGVVIFGPAGRSLPQLPITTDQDGYLVARSDFTVPVGPSYFERDSTGDYEEGDR
ncbi:ubiquinol-cytochrome c reductase iron-sulfur subunit [Propionicicella superfundia]|uniref:cytochrome bc1 complex Rieske iron-sulfur subunit n=1 Tax=Propionicicella superfundia TaxID=348582 RepID=UPI0003FDDAEC|nr:Rieske 2Fe-2S domain-containing protein [Propionicicella superfundia]